MDSPQLLWPGIAGVPVLIGLLWYFGPRLWQCWLRTHRTPMSPPPPVPSHDPHTPLTGGRYEIRCEDGGGSPSPPSSPWLCTVSPPPTDIRVSSAPTVVGSLELPSRPRRLSLRSAALNPSR
jgi:hypothetical protein